MDDAERFVLGSGRHPDEPVAYEVEVFLLESEKYALATIETRYV
jgi:hypothetical protein